MIKKPTTNNHKRAAAVNAVDAQFTTKADESKSFIEHINEFKRRLTLIVLSLIGASLVAYLFNETLMAIIQKPFGQTLYYTSPVGGLNFLIKLCITFGVIAALPIIMYQTARFFAPILEKSHKRAMVPYLVCSMLLAYGGVVFAYFISLPSALHFLTGFSNEDISALITANEYYDFVLAYLLGFAVLFQIPIVVLFINRIKPLTPGGMMKAQRYIILASFIIAAILTPTPDPVNQTIMAMPAILLYQVSVMLVWWTNRKRPLTFSPVFESIPADLIEEVEVPQLLDESNEVPELKKSPPVAPVQPSAAPIRPRQNFAMNDVLVRRSNSRAPARRPLPVRSGVRFMDVVTS